MSANEQGFWFACGAVLLTLLLTTRYYDGNHTDLVQGACLCGGVVLGWIMHDEVENPHWEDPEWDEPLEGE